MNFKEYCDLSYEDKEKILLDVRKCVYRHVQKFIKEQVVSVGNSKIVSFDGVNLNNTRIGNYCFKAGSLIKVEVYVGNNIHESLVNPKYFKSENVKNYLREFEIDVKDMISEIRKNYSSSS